MTMRSATSAAQPETVALFVSDVHLKPSQPKTAEAFLAFLRRHARRTQQLYLLGDLFEYWAGDDDISTPFNQRIVDAIKQVSAAGVAVFWIVGNRDFLTGDTFARATGATQLPEPYIADIAGQKIILVHGDAQCTDDLPYMAFRAQVRQPGWQQQFLAQPLAQRKAIIEGMRSESREQQRSKSYEIMDVNDGAIAALFDAGAATIMIHGHTHRPARHVYPHAGGDRIRYVLPDWDCDGEPARGGWIALDQAGRITRYGVDGTALD